MTNRSDKEQAQRDLDYFLRLNVNALTNPRHPDHVEASEAWVAMNRNLIRLQGRDPNAPSDGFEPVGGAL